MTKDDFISLMGTVKEMRDSVDRHGTALRTNPRLTGHYQHGVHDFINEAHQLASMVSQVLDNEDLSVVQRISLKGALLQLELELRLLQSQLFG